MVGAERAAVGRDAALEALSAQQVTNLSAGRLREGAAESGDDEGESEEPQCNLTHETYLLKSSPSE